MPQLLSLLQCMDILSGNKIVKFHTHKFVNTTAMLKEVFAAFHFSSFQSEKKKLVRQGYVADITVCTVDI